MMDINIPDTTLNAAERAKLTMLYTKLDIRNIICRGTYTIPDSAIRYYDLQQQLLTLDLEIIISPKLGSNAKVVEGNLYGHKSINNYKDEKVSFIFIRV